MGAASLEGDSLACGRTLSVADITIRLADELCPPFSTWPTSYQPFLAEGLADEEGGLRWCLGEDQDRPADDDVCPTYAAGAWQAGTVGVRTLYRFHAGENRPYLWAEPNADFSRVWVWIDPAGARQMPPMLHPVDRVLWMGVLAHRRGMIVHSCGWSCQRRAVLFPGVSGAGKTTLCRQLMAAGAGAVLSDDRMVVRVQADECRASGTPWPGDAKQARNESAPLAAIAFIEQSPVHRVTPIRPADALRRLLEAASVPWYAPALRDMVLPVVEQMVASVPAYRVGFHPDPSVVAELLPLVGESGT
ncbi:MAG: hypothetical protein PHO14_10820 [Kiritimatiellae bacterium]|nr:hypothetical protein [Kiritimatiellia bacterium]